MSDALISRATKSNNINIVQEMGTSTTAIMSQNASTNSFATKTHSHAVSDLTSGTLSVSRGGTGQPHLANGEILTGNGTDAVTTISVVDVSRGGTGQTNLASGEILFGNGTNAIYSTSILPIDKGGTGATNSGWALSNLGIPKESGNWTPSINAWNVNYSSQVGYYERIGNMIYIFCYMVFNIYDAGSDYARVNGLPFTAHGGLKAGFNLIDCANNYSNTAHLRIVNSWGGTGVSVYSADGSTSQKWSTGDGKYLVFSGWYVKG